MGLLPRLEQPVCKEWPVLHWAFLPRTAPAILGCKFAVQKKSLLHKNEVMPHRPCSNPRSCKCKPGAQGFWLPLSVSQASTTGVSPDLTGVSSELTGVSSELTGARPDLTGVSPELTGVLGPELSGVSPELTGVLSSELTGPRLADLCGT
eukprot:5450304-Amphidinium_carterae.1